MSRGWNLTAEQLQEPGSPGLPTPISLQDLDLAEPIRVEGAADEAVEAEAMAMGRAVSEQEEAAVDAAEAVAAM